MISVRSNHISLKYQRFTPSGCKNIGIRKFKFVAKTQFLYPKWTSYEDFKDCICALAEQICIVKTSDRSQMNPKQLTINYCVI